MVKAIRELIEGGYIGQAIIATLVVATLCFLVIAQREVPEWFVGLAATIITWYFREQQQARADRKEIQRQAHTG